MKSMFNSNHSISNPCLVFIPVHAFGQSQYQLFSVAVNINPIHAQPPVYLVLNFIASHAEFQSSLHHTTKSS